MKGIKGMHDLYDFAMLDSAYVMRLAELCVKKTDMLDDYKAEEFLAYLFYKLCEARKFDPMEQADDLVRLARSMSDLKKANDENADVSKETLVSEGR